MDWASVIFSRSTESQFNSYKGVKAHDSVAFLKNVKGSVETYTHIELGAGNYRYGDDGATEYSSCKDKEQVHIASCRCHGCDYGKNKYRYAVLESTIDHIVTQTPGIIKKFLLNDIDCISLDQSVKHARKYVEVTFDGSEQEISIEGLYGDFNNIKLSEFKPTSIHLKNPENYFFQDTLFDFENTTARLFEESSGCQDGGFILVTTQANSLRLKKVFKSTGANYVVEPYELPFDASYHGLQQSECDLWHVKPLAYLCKQIGSTNKKLVAGPGS